MKKLLIALLALGALSFAPTAEAGNRRNCPKKCKKAPVCMKQEKSFKETCAPECTEKTVLDHSYWVPTMVPGKKRIDCYKTYRTCTNVSECCEDVPGEEMCLEDGEQIPAPTNK